MHIFSDNSSTVCARRKNCWQLILIFFSRSLLAHTSEEREDNNKFLFAELRSIFLRFLCFLYEIFYHRLRSKRKLRHECFEKLDSTLNLWLFVEALLALESLLKMREHWLNMKTNPNTNIPTWPYTWTFPSNIYVLVLIKLEHIFHGRDFGFSKKEKSFERCSSRWKEFCWGTRDTTELLYWLQVKENKNRIKLSSESCWSHNNNLIASQDCRVFLLLQTQFRLSVGFDTTWASCVCRRFLDSL